MIRLKDDEYQFVCRYLQLIEQIVKTSAAHSIPADFREKLLDISVLYGWSNCKCNSAIYLSTCRLYNAYLETKKQIEDEERTRKEGEAAKTKSKDISTGRRTRRNNLPTQADSNDK